MLRESHTSGLLQCCRGWLDAAVSPRIVRSSVDLHSIKQTPCFWNPYNKLRRVCGESAGDKRLPTNLQSCRRGLVVTGGSGVACVTTQVLENRQSHAAFVLTMSYVKIWLLLSEICEVVMQSWVDFVQHEYRWNRTLMFILEAATEDALLTSFLSSIEHSQAVNRNNLERSGTPRCWFQRSFLRHVI